MKNRESWQESKFEWTEDGYRASRDPEEVHVGSRFIADILADFYPELLAEYASGDLLDLGCGKVPLFGMYKDFVSENVCIDWENTAHRSPYLDYEFDLTAPLPLPDESFDTVLVTDVLEHILKPDLLWQEMTRLLRPNGKIILGVPFLYWIHEAPHDYYRYTKFSLEYFCQSNGLKVLYLEPYGGAPEVVIDIVSKLAIYSRRRTKYWAALAKMFMNSAVGQRLSANTRQEFPLGYCLVAEKQTTR